jgi:hypothetical protein
MTSGSAEGFNLFIIARLHGSYPSNENHEPKLRDSFMA